MECESDSLAAATHSADREEGVLGAGVWGLWWCQVCRDTTASATEVRALAESFFEPLVAGDKKASLASLSP